jgi:hypothetical protein
MDNKVKALEMKKVAWWEVECWQYAAEGSSWSAEFCAGRGT